MASVTIEWRNDIPYLSWVEGGKRWRRSLGKIEAGAAEKIRSAKEAELTHGVRIIPRLPTVRHFLDAYLDWYETDHPTTSGRARSECKKFIERFGHRPIDTIRPLEIEQYKADRMKLDGVAQETIGKEIRRLSAAFKRGVAWKEIDVNPLQDVQAPRGVRSVAVPFYAKADLRKLYKANPNRAAMWQFLANTGMRRGEAIKATKADIVQYANGKRIRIESIDATERTKSGRMREVPLNAGALAALERLEDRLFPVNRDTLTHWFSEDAREAGIGGNLHRLRHTFCAHLAMAGVPLRRIQILAGHSDYKITERYAHLAPEGSQTEVDKISL